MKEAVDNGATAIGLPGKGHAAWSCTASSPTPARCCVAASTAAVNDARGVLDLLAGAYLLETVGEGRYRFHDLLRAYALGQAGTEEATWSASRL